MVEKGNLCECGCGGYAKPGNRYINGHQNRGENYWKQQLKPQLCKCKCGDYAKPGNKYIRGHSGGRFKKLKLKLKLKPKPKLCKCKCGDYANPGCDYIKGHNRRGVKHTNETITKIKESTKNKPPMTDETKMKISKANSNPSNKTREKMREAQKNRPPMSDETKAKISKSTKNISDEARRKTSETLKNHPVSDETKMKISKANSNPSDETRAKMREARKNRPPVTNKTKAKMAEAQRNQSDETRQKRSAAQQGIPYDEWESFAKEKLYCPDFNEICKESNREKYGRCCFLTELPESENITSTGKQRKLSVHHVDMDKMQGCNDIRWKLIPVCLKWHGKIHNELWEARIIWLLNNVWC